ncbi:MAG: RNB domain-containing ribonuclease, partial [Steroidobacterales bacterium]
LRSQSMAAYQPENRGHFGLALQAYAHFTSPIRRYPDLLVHRAIRYALTGRKPSDYFYSPAEMAAMAVHCSQRERRAEEAERDVDERFKCAWMSKHVGSEFDGVVTGVTSFGLFVELDESKVSGLVHISQLANDYYHFDPIRKLLKGERTGEQYRLGDHVRVQVLRASLEDRKIDFRLVPSKTPAPPPRTGKAYDYAASGERYSLPKAAHKPVAAKPAKAQGMFGKAASAIGRAFGRREKIAEVEPTTSASPAPKPHAARPASEAGNRSRRGPAPASPRSGGGGEARGGKARGGSAAAKPAAEAPTAGRSGRSNRNKGTPPTNASPPASGGGRKRGGRSPAPKGKP